MSSSSDSLVHGDMLIGEVLNLWPDSAEIMQDFGLHCTSCSVNAFEPLKAGAMAHGLEEEVVDDMIARIDEMAKAKSKAPADGIYVTARAAEKIMEFATAENKTDWGLKITAKDNGGNEPAYSMDFQKEAGNDDKTWEFHGVSIFADPESLPNLAGAEIDFLETAYGSGFKITNTRFKSKGGCGSGGCGCGGNNGGSCSSNEEKAESEGCACSGH